ncbi:hypothetical protein BJ978_001484 [Agromyces terreus]|uniref:Uncharacterized protein n=1 Tax=Agromyces terreus TaxID=424795 RepID=A0A9X2KAX4_9MICO|nr:hypothetical protein [Agromyces terreus]MCP2370808.1 hypothetical protein [Agromyces terreus]
MNTTHCEFSASDFTATAVSSSAGRIVHVTGFGLCPTSGWELSLVAANPGVVPHPESLWLELRERAPRGRRRRALVDTPVEAIIEGSQATEVVIRFAWREPFSVPVVEVVPNGRSDAATRRAAASVVS